MELVTKEDLELFKQQLIAEIRNLFSQQSKNKSEVLPGLKTTQARNLLGCCPNTLKALRIAGKVRAKKELGNWYYNREDIRKLVEEGFDKKW